MEAGALIDYRLHYRGVPLGWTSQIEVWEPGRQFVDRQLRGPYGLWHHRHTFSRGRRRDGDRGRGPLRRAVRSARRARAAAVDRARPASGSSTTATRRSAGSSSEEASRAGACRAAGRVMSSLLWLRRDLRLRDHPALSAAAQGRAMTVVFCFDEQLLGGRHASGPRTQFMLESLAELGGELKATWQPPVRRRRGPGDRAAQARRPGQGPPRSTSAPTSDRSRGGASARSRTRWRSWAWR